MQPIGKRLVTAMVWQQEPIGKKLALEFFFVKIIYATPLVYLFLQLFYFFIIQHGPSEKVSFN